MSHQVLVVFAARMSGYLIGLSFRASLVLAHGSQFEQHFILLCRMTIDRHAARNTYSAHVQHCVLPWKYDLMIKINL